MCGKSKYLLFSILLCALTSCAQTSSLEKIQIQDAVILETTGLNNKETIFEGVVYTSALGEECKPVVTESGKELWCYDGNSWRAVKAITSN